MIASCTVLALFAQIEAAVSQEPTSPIRPLPPPPPGVISPLKGDLHNPNDLRHRDVLGRACLTLAANSRPLPSSPNIFEHVVMARNSCLTRIRLKLCYHQSERCYMVEVPPNERKDTTLGIMPAMRSFRYDYQEQY